MSEYPYVWTWRSRTEPVKGPWFGDGVDRVGQACRVVVRDGTAHPYRDGEILARIWTVCTKGPAPDPKTMSNSALIEFEDGYRVVTSRGGLRKAKP